MLYTYDKRKKTLTPCEETDFKTHGLMERQDIEKWVEQNPDILGEELLIVTTEYDKFDKTNERLDLLAIDKEGNVVVIELKRDDSGKNVDLQALKYAAFCSTHSLDDLASMYASYLKQEGGAVTPDAAREMILKFIDNDDFEELNDRPRIILVSREFRPEVTASVLWLRKFGMDIRCVKLDLYHFSDDVMAINSSVLIPLPEAEEYLVKAERKEMAEHTQSVTHTEYVQFFTQCVESLKKRLPRDYSPPVPRAYYQIQTGIGSVHFEWGFHGRPRSSFGVELHFEKGNKETNLAFLTACVKLKSSLETALHEKVVIQEDWGKAWARLYVEKQEGKVTDELRDWAVDKMNTLITVLQPEIDKLRKS
jgi:hypothetical protein